MSRSHPPLLRPSDPQDTTRQRQVSPLHGNPLLLRTERGSLATALREFPLRLVVQTTSYATFPSQPPCSDSRGRDRVLQTLTRNRPAFSTSSQQTSHPFPRSFRPNPTTTGDSASQNSSGRENSARFRRVFFNGLCATSLSSTDPTSTSHTSAVQDPGSIRFTRPTPKNCAHLPVHRMTMLNISPKLVNSLPFDSSSGRPQRRNEVTRSIISLLLCCGGGLVEVSAAILFRSYLSDRLDDYDFQTFP